MRYLSAFLALAALAQQPKTVPAKVTPVVPVPVVVKEDFTIKTTSLARVVQYGPRDTVRVVTRPLYDAVIILPERDNIMEMLIGDGEYWTRGKMANTAWVKPAKNKSETNLTLITEKGLTYSFYLVSDHDQDPDFKVFIELRDDGMIQKLNGAPKFIEASAVEGIKSDAEMWRIEAARLRKEMKEQVEVAKAQAAVKAPVNIKHDYKFDSDVAPFNIVAMFHDGKFTYIQAHPEEALGIYEIKDGKPNLIDFRPENGTLVSNKVLANGYFQIGNKKLGFERRR